MDSTQSRSHLLPLSPTCKGISNEIKDKKRMSHIQKDFESSESRDGSGESPRRYVPNTWGSYTKTEKRVDGRVHGRRLEECLGESMFGDSRE